MPVTAIHTLELRAPRPVSLPMATAPANPEGKRRPVRPALLVALGLSLLLHAAWSLWPADEIDTPEGTVLEATITEMPPPPVPTAQPAPPPPPAQKPIKRTRTIARKPTAPPAAIAAPDESAPVIDEGTTDVAKAEPGPSSVENIAKSAETASEPAIASEPAPPAVALPPRVDLAYKVFLGTQGFMIGEATYRFEHADDRYRISTVGQARGLAALIVRGTGKIESHGRITQHGLRPYEFAIERGSADRREVAFFDWDAGNVVLNDGARAQLDAPAFDPLTILWQPYFSPPGKSDLTFSIATTRKVARYTLKLQGEETIDWSRGRIATERWHRVSEDGNTEGWFWLAPSLHYIPVKMRVTRTTRGTLEVLLDSIRIDDPEKFGLAADMAGEAPASATQSASAEPKTADDIVYGMPGSGMPALTAEQLRGQ